METAEEYLKEKVYITDDGIEDVHDSLSSVAEAMRNFAKMHVEAALKKASEIGYRQGETTFDYLLENIK